VPVVIRYDYHGKVPGARERAIEHCHRVKAALANRYKDLSDNGFLHCLQVVRDITSSGLLEVIGNTVDDGNLQEAH